MGGVDRSGVAEKRRVLADLHVHVGRAAGGPVKITASPRLTPAAALEESSDRKGLDAVAVVDAHSPRVLADLDRLVRSGELEPLPGGGLRRSGERPLLLLPASEVEVVEHGLGPVHYLCYLPDLDTALGFSGFLSGRVTNVALGSPRARSSGEELARWVGREGGFLVPAHVFTPHKGYFGQGGRDLSRHLSDRALEAIPAVELGLSADTAMAEAVPSLGPFTFLSNSDAHSPETIAREHNALMVGEPRPAGPAAGEGSNPPGEMDFQTLFSAVRDGRVAANYGLDPRLGKYHRAFCPRCGFRADLAEGARPSERAQAGAAADGRPGAGPGGRPGAGPDARPGADAVGAANRRGVCPACGAREFVGGVFDRVLQLSGGGAVREAPGAEPGATREEGGRTGRPRRARPPYVHQIPLRYVPGVGPAVVRRLIAAFGTELRVLHEVEEEDLASVVGPRLAARLAAARRGTAALDIVPGAGGRYGRVRPPT
jgi:PHP family Zn ribbon phosphoesterase